MRNPYPASSYARIETSYGVISVNPVSPHQRKPVLPCCPSCSGTLQRHTIRPAQRTGDIPSVVRRQMRSSNPRGGLLCKGKIRSLLQYTFISREDRGWIRSNLCLAMRCRDAVSQGVPDDVKEHDHWTVRSGTKNSAGRESWQRRWWMHSGVRRARRGS